MSWKYPREKVEKQKMLQCYVIKYVCIYVRPPQKFNPSFYHYEQFLPHDKYSYSKTYPLQFIQNQILTPTPLPWKRLYLNFWVHYFHKSHILNELQLIQNMMLVNSKLPKTFEIFAQTSDSTYRVIQ